MSAPCVVLALAFAFLVPAAGAHAQSQPSPARPMTAGYLFVLRAGGGQLERLPGQSHQFKLVLRRPDRDVTRFTDRPARRVGQRRLGRFVRSWPRLGFRQVPPNAALVIEDAPASRDVLVVELSRPRLRAGGRALVLRARVLSGNPGGLLRDLARRADRRVAKQFKRVSLFIDPGTQQTVLSFSFSKLLSNDRGAFACPSAVIDTAEGDDPFRMVTNAPGPVDIAINPTAFEFTIGDIGSTSVSATLAIPIKLDDDIVRLRCFALFPPYANANVTIGTSGKTFPVVGGWHQYPLN